MLTINGPFNYETVYTYDGKLVRAKSSRLRTEFTYSGDNIVSMMHYVDPDNDNYNHYSEGFEYNTDGTLKRVQFITNSTPSSSAEYTYNLDGTVNIAILENDSSISLTGKFTIVNGEVTKFEYVYSGTPAVSEYRYDNKNHPLKNVTGYNKLLLFNFLNQSVHDDRGYSTNCGNYQNQTSVKDSNIGPDFFTNRNIEYNDADFPVSITYIDDDIVDHVYYE